MEIKKLLHLFEGKPQKFGTQSNITVEILLARVSNVLSNEWLHQLFKL